VRDPVKREGSPLIVGRYAIHGEISSGGMASVHFGRLVGPVGFARTVAIKRLHAQYARDPDFVAMFLDEARIAARIQHPNVVPTLDIVSTDGELFLVMEYIQGETLSRLQRALRERAAAVPAPIAAMIVAGVLHGLHAAHEAKDERGKPLNIVHRDVSPQNVIVGIDGVPRVLDFGVAKAAVRLQTTREGQLKGKLAYMAPEQLAAGVVTRLSDVYAAGVLLWEALTGRRLFEADTEGHLLSLVLKGHVGRPSEIDAKLAGPLDDIAMRALERDPQKRFQTAREMGLALERSVALAMPSEVGEWVESIAREGLAIRAKKVGEIESSTDSRPPKAPDADTVPPARPRGISADVTRVDEHEPTAVTPHTPSARVPSVAPQRAPDSLTPSSVKRPEKPEKGTRRRILVIDDSEVMLTRIRRALEADGYDVTTTTRAVGNARHIPTSDLVVIDYHMPGIDGGTVIASLKAAVTRRGPDAPACLFYLYTSDPVIAKDYARHGFDGSFTDKGNEEALVRQVRAVFRVLQMRALQKRVKPPAE
jgi:serine/threonine-protein kinase